MRTMSIEGTRRVIASAIVTSAAQGVPKESPSRTARSTAALTVG